MSGWFGGFAGLSDAGQSRCPGLCWGELPLEVMTGLSWWLLPLASHSHGPAPPLVLDGIGLCVTLSWVIVRLLAIMPGTK